MFAVLAGVSMLAQTVVPSAGVFGAEYSEELQGAYNWAYSKGVTTMSSIDNANMYGAITRAEMAKMLSVYAESSLGITADTSKACTFTDIDSVKGDLHDFIIKSCQLGIMGQGITAFRPYDTLSRAEFGTALSRVLWGDKYEGGTPYYANHLNALKAAGIMNQIANAESTKEVRGYVMLMLQRSEGSDAGVDCDDPVVALACSLDTDECPAACKANSDKEETVVKSGDLAVTAKAATDRKAIVTGAVSDLDTLTFKTSENVEITKIVLERYGYSTKEDVATVSLEDDDGNVIAEGKALNSKDQVTLSIKKDYRKVDGTYNATIVLTTSSTAKAGGTIGFKVVDVESTAKNLNVDNYSPYTYDMVNYDGATATIDAKGTPKNYNFEAGESYEVARFKVSAASSALTVNGFTLKNQSSADVDVEKFLDKVTVYAGSEKVDGLKYSVNKSKELVISFDDVEVAAKKNVTFIVNISFSDDFDDYGRWITYAIEKQSNFNAIEKKTWARLTVNLPAIGDWVGHQFNGSKIRLTNVKTSNVDAAAGSEGVVIGQWEISISETVSLPSFTITAANTWVDDMTLVIAGEEYDGSNRKVAGSNVTFTFNGIEIENSGKVQVKVDLNKDAEGTVTFNPSTLNKVQFSGARYVDARQSVQSGDVAGSITFASKLTVQAAKAALENKLTKTVEFVKDETARKVVFDGTYTARKGDVNLNKFTISGSVSPATPADTNDIEYYVFIDGTEVGNTSSVGSEEIFSDVKVKDGASVTVKVEAVVTADDTTLRTYDMTLYLEWEDNDGNRAGVASDAVKTFKTVAKGGVEVSTSASKKTIALKQSNSNIATFTVKPSNTNDEVMLEDLVISVHNDTTNAYLADTEFRVKVDNVEQYDPTGTSNVAGYTYTPNENIPSEGLKVTVDLKAETAWTFTVSVLKVNTKTYTDKTFKKQFVAGVAYISKQQDLDGTTKFTLAIDGKADSSYSFSGFTIYDEGNNVLGSKAGEFEDGDTFEAVGTGAVKMIKKVTYTVEWAGAESGVVVTYDAMPDYFKVEGNDARVYKVKN